MSDTVAILGELGIQPKSVRKNWNEARLYETSVATGEARVAEGGPLVVETGQHTGRSAKDKFTVRDETTENTVWWDNNASMTPAQFDALFEDFKVHLAAKDVFAQELFGGADLSHRLPVTVALAVHPPPAAPSRTGET
jgi:phosphoenolpyruvate carboxykinase (ATP)